MPGLREEGRRGSPGGRIIRRKDNDMFEPRWEEKVWGKVWHLFAADYAAVSILEVKAGFRCSKHLHHERDNMFAVQNGLVLVEWFLGDYVTRKAWLGPGDHYTVSSGIWHRFRVAEPGTMVEIYWPNTPDGRCRIDDITRADEGGPDPDIVWEAVEAGRLPLT